MQSSHTVSTVSGPLGELRAISTAGGGSSLSTTPIFLTLPRGTRYVAVTPNTFAGGAVALQLAVNPYLCVFKTTDNLSSVTDYSTNAQDNDTSTTVVLSSLDTAANGDFFYVGGVLPFRGVRCIVGSANGSANTITVKYWNGSAFADISATDGTISGGCSIGQTGNVTWTVPSDWGAATLETINTPDSGAVSPYYKRLLFWTRWQWSAAMDSSTTLTGMQSMNRSTTYYEVLNGQSFEEEVYIGPDAGGVSCVELRTDAGTAKAVVNVATQQNGRFV